MTTFVSPVPSTIPSEFAASPCNASLFSPPNPPHDGAVCAPQLRRPWRSSLVLYSQKNFYFFLQRWSSMYSPLLLSWDAFCRVFLPADGALVEMRKRDLPHSQSSLRDRGREVHSPPRVHASTSCDASRHLQQSCENGCLPRKATPRDPAASASTREYSSAKAQGEDVYGRPDDGAEGEEHWPSVRQMSRDLDASGLEEEAFRETEENLENLAEDVWAAFQCGGGLESLQLFGALAWLLPTCLRGKCRALCRVFDITGTGKLTFAELSILLDRSLQGLGRLLACPALSGVAAPYSAALLSRAVTAKNHSIRGVPGAAGTDNGEESNGNHDRNGEAKDEANEGAVVHVANNEPVPWNFLMGVLQEVERRISLCLQPALELADTLRLTLPSFALPLMSSLRPGSVFLGHYEILRLLHNSARVPHSRVVFKAREKATGQLFALKLVVNREDRSSLRPGHYRPCSWCSSSPASPALCLSSFLAEAAHLHKRTQILRDAGRAHTARCILHGEIRPFAFQLLAWEGGETLEAFLSRKRITQTPKCSFSAVSSAVSSSSPQLRAPAFSEKALVDLWLSLLSLLEEQHRVGLTHGQLQPRKILVQQHRGASFAPWMSSVEAPECVAEEKQLAGGSGCEDAQRQIDSLADSTLVLLDWQLGIDAREPARTETSASSADTNVPPAAAALCGSREETSPSLHAAERGAAGSLEDEVSHLVAEARRRLLSARALGVSPREVEQELPSVAGAGALAGAYAPPEQQFLQLSLAAEAAAVGRGERGLCSSKNGEGREREGGSTNGQRRKSRPRFPSLEIRKTWDLYATARLIAECVTLEAPTPLSCAPTFWEPYEAEDGGKKREDEAGEDGQGTGRESRQAEEKNKDENQEAEERLGDRWMSEEAPGGGERGGGWFELREEKERAFWDKRFKEVEELKNLLQDLQKNLRHLPRALADAAQDCLQSIQSVGEALQRSTLVAPAADSAGGLSSPSLTFKAATVASPVSSSLPLKPSTPKQVTLDLRGVKFDPFRIRYLAKFARHLNAETLILPAASSSLRSPPSSSPASPLPFSSSSFSSASPVKQQEDTREDAEGRGFISVPLAKMLNPGGTRLSLSAKGLSSLEAALVARTLLTASWIEELRMNDNAFGSAPACAAPYGESPCGESAHREEQSWQSSAAAQLLGVSLTCMRNLQVLDLNRCHLFVPSGGSGAAVQKDLDATAPVRRRRLTSSADAGRAEETVDLEARGSGESVCRLAATALKQDWLKMEEIDFSFGQISDAGLALLADAIAVHARLQVVNLSGNPITVIGLRSLCRALGSNHSVALLSMNNVLALESRAPAPFASDASLASSPVLPSTASPRTSALGTQASLPDLPRLDQGCASPSPASEGRKCLAGSGEGRESSRGGAAEKDEATLLYQMIQRAVGFNVQYKELRRHTSAFEIAVGATLMCETLASWLDGDSYLQKKLLARLHDVRQHHKSVSSREVRLHHGRNFQKEVPPLASCADPGKDGNSSGLDTPGDGPANAVLKPAVPDPPATASWAPGDGGSRPAGAPPSLTVSLAGEEEEVDNEERDVNEKEGERRGRFMGDERAEQDPEEELESKPRIQHSRRLEDNNETKDRVHKNSRVRFALDNQVGEAFVAGSNYQLGLTRRESTTKSLEEEDEVYLDLEIAVADRLLTRDGAALHPGLFPAFKQVDLKELAGLFNVSARWKMPESDKEVEGCEHHDPRKQSGPRAAGHEDEKVEEFEARDLKPA
uniref:Leucine rich repeat protein, putative n=1 Tax=Toxoplasma gondii (strain ATCC 50861 / VEG) TaxID=432359 RepID=A0A0F7UZ22_TOXGV|nr:TPA: leucine rich repeat protein, putative [Toxoplasma gondii VEG]